MNLEVFDGPKLLKIKEEWLHLLPVSTHAIYHAECSQLFDMIETGKLWGELDSRYNIPIYHAISNGNEILALVQIVQSRNGSSTWVKLMDIHLSPKIDNDDSADERLKVFTSALLGIFKLTQSVTKVDRLKVFGRTDALVSFLRGMHNAYVTITTIGSINGVEVSIEGRWLVFKATKLE